MSTDTDARYFIQQNDRGDLLWLDNGTHRPHYCTEKQAKERRYVPLYVEIPKPIEGICDDQKDKEGGI